MLWDAEFRIGTARVLDVEDCHLEEQYVEIRHRPEKGTLLKNWTNAECEVNLHPWVAETIADYIDVKRDRVTDEHGREPLFTTRNGRVHQTTLRAQVNALTRPCYYSGECPHDRDQSSCETSEYEYAQQCPFSVSPHPIRRSAITAWLNEGHRKELISDRMDVSPDTLDKGLVDILD